VPDKNESAKKFRGRYQIRPGQPIEVTEQYATTDVPKASPLCEAMGTTLIAYSKAARELVDGRYASIKRIAPPHLRLPCHIYVLCCPDGVLVRYDASGEQEPKVRYCDYGESITKVAPAFSDQMIHLPDDPATYIPEHTGPAFCLGLKNEEGGLAEISRIHPVMFASKMFPTDFKLPPPPARPSCLASVNRNFYVNIDGLISPVLRRGRFRRVRVIFVHTV
jgi:hypothetical protein